jgi:hypothetical protein
MYWSELRLPGVCSVADNRTAVLSYQPRAATLASSNASWKSSVPDGGGGGVPACVTVNVWPATVTVPLRDVEPVFAVIE